MPKAVVSVVSQTCVAVVESGLSCLQRSANHASFIANNMTQQGLTQICIIKIQQNLWRGEGVLRFGAV